MPASTVSGIASLKFKLKKVISRMIPAGRQLVRTGEYFLQHGEREVHLLATLVEKGSVAIDVGAHIGDYTYALCKQLGSAGQVIAIEPQPVLANRLKQSVKQLQLPVVIHNCALSSKEGEADLMIPLDKDGVDPGLATLEARTGPASECYRVPLRRLDDVCRDVAGHISFIKIDVEGHELNVLQGATEILAKHRPNLLIEIEQRHSSKPISQTFEFLASIGYQCEFMNPDGQLVSFDGFSIEKNQDPSKLGTTSYVSNFIFKPA